MKGHAHPTVGYVTDERKAEANAIVDLIYMHYDSVCMYGTFLRRSGRSAGSIRCRWPMTMGYLHRLTRLRLQVHFKVVFCIHWMLVYLWMNCIQSHLLMHSLFRDVVWAWRPICYTVTPYLLPFVMQFWHWLIFSYRKSSKAPGPEKTWGPDKRCPRSL